MRKLVSLYYKILSRGILPRNEWGILVDECINAQHNSGFILDLDIQALKNEFENKRPLFIFDKAFCILTRNALESEINRLKGTFDALFIDFNNVSLLNKKLGYKKVNSLFRRIFKTFSFRDTDIIGRWFSGDEIVIITQYDNIEELCSRFKKHVNKIGIDFKFKIMKNVKSLNNLVHCIEVG